MQGASEIPPDRASVVLQGPADCAEEEEREENVGEAEDVETQCAAALNGGLDDFRPLRLWDAVMEKYKLAQLCKEELARLDAVEDKSEIDRLKQKEAFAVAQAVEGIAQLHHGEVLKELEAFA